MSERDERAPILVLGIGNTLLRDDGVGVELLAQLARELRDDPRFELVDGGTQGVALLGCFNDRAGVLLLDAEQRGAAPGTVYSSDASDVASHARGDTAHGSNAGELLAVVRFTGTHAGPVLLVGVEPDEVRTGCGLSTAVQGAVPQALDAARNALEALVRGAEEVSTCTR